MIFLNNFVIKQKWFENFQDFLTTNKHKFSRIILYGNIDILSLFRVYSSHSWFHFINKLKNCKLNLFMLFLLALGINTKQALAEKVSISEKNVTIYSNTSSINNNGVSSYDGNVLLIFDDFTIEADSLIFDINKGYVTIKGNIRLINNEIEVLAPEINIDLKLESVKITNPSVNVNNYIDFKAKEIFALKSFINIDGFRFDEKDEKIPFNYSLIIDKIKVLPIFNNKYFYTQIYDVNGGIFNFDNLSPVNFPAYSFYLRNPSIPKVYTDQRRVRGFYDTGSYFVNGGLDGLSGPWISGTVAYMSNKNSNGFLTAQYSLYSGLDLNIYQDLTDNKDNLIQFSSQYYNYHPYLKKSLFSSNLSFIHDWKYEILSARFTVNQTAGTTVVNKLPELTLSSVYRIEPNTGIQYKYITEASRLFVEEKNKKTQDVGKLKLNLAVNTPKYNVNMFNNSFYFQGLSESDFLYYFDKGNQQAFAWQLEMESKIFERFSYSLRYRQRNSFGKNPVIFENLVNYNLIGLQFNYFINDFITLAAFDEFNLKDNKLTDVFMLASYKTKHYDMDLLIDINPYNIQDSGVRTNFNIRNF